MAAEAAAAAVGGQGVAVPLPLDDTGAAVEQEADLAADLAAPQGDEDVLASGVAEVAGVPPGEAAEVPDRHAAVEAVEDGLPAHLARGGDRRQAGVAAGRLAGEEGFQRAVAVEVGGDHPPVEGGVVGLPVALHLPAHPGATVPAAGRLEAEDLLVGRLHDHLDASVAVEIGDHGGADVREGLAAELVQPRAGALPLKLPGGAPALPRDQGGGAPFDIRGGRRLQAGALRPLEGPQGPHGAAAVRTPGRQRFPFAGGTDHEEVGPAVAVGVPGDHGAQAVGGARAHRQGQVVEGAAAEGGAVVAPALDVAALGEGPYRERGIGRQGLSFRFRQEPLRPAVGVDVVQPVEVPPGEVVDRLAAEGVHGDRVPEAVAGVVVDAVDDLHGAVPVGVEEGRGPGADHLGRLRRIGLDLADPEQGQPLAVVVDDLGVHAEVGDDGELGVGVVVDVGGGEEAIVAVVVVARLHHRLARGAVEDEDAVVGGHRQVELAVGVGVDDDDVWGPGVLEGLGLPHDPRLPRVVSQEPAALRLRPPVGEGVAHLEALQAGDVGEEPGHLEEVVHWHGDEGAVAGQVVEPRAQPPGGPLAADPAGVEPPGEGQLQERLTRAGGHRGVALPGGDVVAPGFGGRAVRHAAGAGGAAAHVPVAAQLQPLAGALGGGRSGGAHRQQKEQGRDRRHGLIPGLEAGAHKAGCPSAPSGRRVVHIEIAAPHGVGSVGGGDRKPLQQRLPQATPAGSGEPPLPPVVAARGRG